MDFKLVSDYAPMGDQPEAIEQLVGSIRHGSKHNTLLGVTGSGKTFTVANVVAQLNRPTLVLSHNKTLAAQLYGEFLSLIHICSAHGVVWNETTQRLYAIGGQSLQSFSL